MVCAAVATSPSALIIEAKATYPSDVPKRWSMLGTATRRHGRRIALSGRMRSPRGEMRGCRQSRTVMMTPPTVYAMALATAAPRTPQPAPGIVTRRPRTVAPRAG